MFGVRCRPRTQVTDDSRVRLLLDQNLSFKLVHALADLYPDSAHVRVLGLDTADDVTVWEHARANGFVIVSKDSDFYQRSVVFGHPPKVIWVRRGNCSTADIATIRRSHYDDIVAFAADDAVACLMLT